MNPENIIVLENKVSSLEQKLDDAIKIINGLKIDNQRKLDSNIQIPPGIACKVAYDKNGLIIKGDKLLASDIPPLQIDAIDGLRKILDLKANAADIKKVSSDSSESTGTKRDIIGTGTKINYNSDGIIISTSDLSEDDIPNLPISHIINLKEEMDLIKASITPVVEVKEIMPITPGTFTKITYDSNGRVVSGTKLSIDDIPIDIINKINIVEGKIPSLASQTSIDSINKILRSKLDGNQSTTPGTFTKLTIDSKGLVIRGDKLTVKDLPELNISDIVDLAGTLRNKANQSDLIEMNNNISSVVSSINRLGDVSNIRSALQLKADNKELKELNSKVNSLQNLVDALSSKIPNELIMEQLQQIQNELSSISGRILVLENKIGISDAFDD